MAVALGVLTGDLLGLRGVRVTLEGVVALGVFAGELLWCLGVMLVASGLGLLVGLPGLELGDLAGVATLAALAGDLL